MMKIDKALAKVNKHSCVPVGASGPWYVAVSQGDLSWFYLHSDGVWRMSTDVFRAEEGYVWSGYYEFKAVAE